jgi:succinate-semialdehyde dehydrogenase/glutarate-semialdehyde dehydrogenase
MSTQKVVGLARRTVASVSPLTGELLREFEQHSDDAVESKIARAAATFREYRKVPFAQRAAWMLRAAEILESEKDKFGSMMTQEMGKTLKSAVQEAEKSALGCRYYAENAERFLADEEAKTNATRSFVRYQPIGPVLAVMPWNFPFWQVFRFAAPALMAGNVGY